MSLISYFTSLAISVFSLVMAILLFFAEVNGTEYKFFGDTELYACMLVAVVLMIVGLRCDRK